MLTTKLTSNLSLTVSGSFVRDTSIASSLVSASTNFSVVTGSAVRAISGVTPTGDNQYLRINASLTSSGTVGNGGYIQLQSGYNALWSAEL